MKFSVGQKVKVIMGAVEYNNIGCIQEISDDGLISVEFTDGIYVLFEEHELKKHKGRTKK
jgi:hypothetical protein